MDRVSLQWTGAQLDVIGELALSGKPMIVLQMGGGQIDSSPISNNPNISALLWGGYPGQDGGVAIFDILTGKKAPAGRLPTTQYPADYIHQVPMTDMNLRPGANNPGRTYQWYNGTPVFDFGTGLHYTNFSASVTTTISGNLSISNLMSGCNMTYLDLCPFQTINVDVTNRGSVASDYVTLGFLAGTFGPAPHPIKSLVAYERLFDIAPGSCSTAALNLTLGSLARADEQGNKVLYPGDYALMVDTQPLTMVNFTLSGIATVIDAWPQAPQEPALLDEDYFVGGFGSLQPL